MDAIELAIPPEEAPEHREVILSAHTIGSKLSSHPTFKGVNIICTLGSAGLIAFVSLAQDAGRQALYLPAAKLNGPVVDTTGAGDCFTGYFVSGLMGLGQGGKADLVGALSVSIKVRPPTVTPLTPSWVLTQKYRLRECVCRGEELLIASLCEGKLWHDFVWES